jgi:hypothetical protein
MNQDEEGFMPVLTRKQRADFSGGSSASISSSANSASASSKSKFSAKTLLADAMARICWERTVVNGKAVPGPSVFLGGSQRHVKVEKDLNERPTSCSISWQMCEGGIMGWRFTNGRDQRHLVEAGYSDCELDQLVGAIICCFVFPEQCHKMRNAVPRTPEEREEASKALLASI